MQQQTQLSATAVHKSPAAKMLGLKSFFTNSTNMKKALFAFTLLAGITAGAQIPQKQKTTFAGAVEFKRTVVRSSVKLSSAYSYVAADASKAAITLTLPAASTCPGRTYTFKKIDAGDNVVTISCTGSETLEGAAHFYLNDQWDYMTVIAGSNGWELLDIRIGFRVRQG